MIYARFSRYAALMAGLVAVSSPACRGRRSNNQDAGSEAAARSPSTLVGLVQDLRKVAVPAARVLCWPKVGDTPPRELRSQADGRFAIPDLPPGSYQMLVEAPGFDSLTVPEVKVPGIPVVLTLQGETRSVTGVVRLKGAPVAEARVQLGELERPPREVRTAPDGSFAFHGLGPGTYRLRAARGQHVSPSLVLPPAGTPGGVEVQLGPGVIVSGKTIDDTGAAVSAAEVSMESVPADGLLELATSNEEGLWAIGPLPPGEYLVGARATGYLKGDGERVALSSSGAGRARHTLTLVRAARVRGRVLDGDGKPVPAQTLRVARTNAGQLSVVLGALPLAAEAAALPSTRVPQIGRARTGSSDAAGRFEIVDLAPGRASLELAPTGKVPVRAEVVLEAGRVADVGDLVLRDGVAVSGRILDEAGMPVDAQLTARTRIAAFAPILAGTDRYGMFAFVAPPGELEITASASGMSTEAVSVAVGAAPPPPVEIRLIRADVVVEGVVRDSDGRPVHGARVAAGTIVTAGAGTTLGSGTTDPGGHFRLTGLPRRSLKLEASHRDYPSASAEVEPGTPVSLVLPVPGGVAGDVREWGSGAPLATWSIEARGPNGRTVAATKGAAGAFKLLRLAPGTWTITVRAPGYLPAEQSIGVPAAPILGDLSVRDLRIELRK